MRAATHRLPRRPIIVLRFRRSLIANNRLVVYRILFYFYTHCVCVCAALFAVISQLFTANHIYVMTPPRSQHPLPSREQELSKHFENVAIEL